MAGEGGGAGAVAPGQVVGGGLQRQEAGAPGGRGWVAVPPGARSPPAAVFLVNACVHPPSLHNYSTCVIVRFVLSSPSDRIQLENQNLFDNFGQLPS